MTARTSDRVSTIAARHAQMNSDRLLSLTATAGGREELASDIRSMAASLLRQDEVKGFRKILRLVTG